MPKTDSEPVSTRRQVLRNLLLVSVGAGVSLLGISEIIRSVSKTALASTSGTDSLQTQSNSFQIQTTNDSVVGSSFTTGSSSTRVSNSHTYFTIKVVYFGMSVQITGTKQEYLSLPAPVFLEDVLARIRQEHVVLSTMLPTMQVVIDGTPAQNNPQLANNAEVDFIPVFAGG